MSTFLGHSRSEAPSPWITQHPATPSCVPSLDPLDPDQADDTRTIVSRRGLVRLALVATETGARFQREGTSQDPLDWLTTPRALFDGRDALDACMERTSCFRAVVLHGLGLHLDADGQEVDELMGSDRDDDDTGTRNLIPFAPQRSNARSTANKKPRLFTATLVYDDDTGVLQAFDAAVVRSSLEMRDRISQRLGADVAQAAEITEGFHPSCPLVNAFLSDGMADMLRQVAAAPESPLAAGLEVVMQQRFAL